MRRAVVLVLCLALAAGACPDVTGRFDATYVGKLE
jgi:hypothetical protein